MIKTKQSASGEVQKQRRKLAIEAITDPDVGLIYPTEQFNQGCDVVWVLDLEGDDDIKGIGIFMFETKYYFFDGIVGNNKATDKAIKALEGLIKSGVFASCNVLFVGFILCTTIRQHQLVFDTKKGSSLQKIIKTLEEKKITVSLHHLNTEEWIRLLTPPLYFALRDISEGTEYAKPMGRFQKISQHMQK